jgi:hypothetical protein
MSGNVTHILYESQEIVKNLSFSSIPKVLLFSLALCPYMSLSAPSSQVVEKGVAGRFTMSFTELIEKIHRQI